MTLSVRKFAAAVMLATPLASHAQDDVARFYQGKAVTVQVGSEAGGQ